MQAGHPQRLRPAARDPLRLSAMMTVLLLALVLLLVCAGWLWAAPRVPGVCEAGPVELLTSLAAGHRWAAYLRRGSVRVPGRR